MLCNKFMFCFQDTQAPKVLYSIYLRLKQVERQRENDNGISGILWYPLLVNRAEFCQWKNGVKLLLVI